MVLRDMMEVIGAVVGRLLGNNGGAPKHAPSESFHESKPSKFYSDVFDSFPEHSPKSPFQCKHGSWYPDKDGNYHCGKCETLWFAKATMNDVQMNTGEKEEDGYPKYDFPSGISPLEHSGTFMQLQVGQHFVFASDEPDRTRSMEIPQPLKKADECSYVDAAGNIAFAVLDMLAYVKVMPTPPQEEDAKLEQAALEDDSRWEEI